MSANKFIKETFEQGKGILRLIPVFVPRRFSTAGLRLRLHPDDYYAMGTKRGAIKERWFSSVIPCMNGELAPEDEGLSYGFQQAETVNTILLSAGIDDNIPGTIRIMPRLPENWGMSATDYPVIVYSGGESYTSNINMTVSYPKNGEQSVTLKTMAGGELMNVNFRLGPFSAALE